MNSGYACHITQTGTLLLAIRIGIMFLEQWLIRRLQHEKNKIDKRLCQSLTRGPLVIVSKWTATGTACTLISLVQHSSYINCLVTALLRVTLLIAFDGQL